MGRAAMKVEGFEENLAALSLSRAVASLHGLSSNYGGPGWKAHDGSWDDSVPFRSGEPVGQTDYVPDPDAKPLVASRLNFRHAQLLIPALLRQEHC